MSEFKEENNLSTSLSSLIKAFAAKHEEIKVEEIIPVFIEETVEEAVVELQPEIPEVILLDRVDHEHQVENSEHILTSDEMSHLDNVPNVELVNDFKNGDEDVIPVDNEYMKNFDPATGFDFKDVDLELIEVNPEENADVIYADNNNQTENIVDGVYVIQEKKDLDETQQNYETTFQSGATELMSDLSSYNEDKDNDVVFETSEVFTEEIVEVPNMPDMKSFDPTRYFGVQQDAPTRPESLVEIVELEERRGTYDEAVDILTGNAEENPEPSSIIETPAIIPTEDKGASRSISDMLKELSSLKD